MGSERWHASSCRGWMMELGALPTLQPQIHLSRMPSHSPHLPSSDSDLIPVRWWMMFSGMVPVGMEGVPIHPSPSRHYSPLLCQRAGWGIAPLPFTWSTLAWGHWLRSLSSGHICRSVCVWSHYLLPSGSTPHPVWGRLASLLQFLTVSCLGLYFRKLTQCH